MGASSGSKAGSWAPAAGVGGCGEVGTVRLLADGRLYVGFYGLSHSLVQPLERAAAKRYGWPLRDSGSQVYVDFPIRIIPYKAGYFAFTWGKPGLTRDSDYAKSPHQGRGAVWEYVSGRWSLIFDFDCKVTTDQELARLFRKNRFSAKMRRRLTIDSLLGFNILSTSVSPI